MPLVVNARNIRNGWGVNTGETDSNAVTALKYIQTRLVRMQIDGDITGIIQGFQDNLVSGNAFDPNLRLQLLLNDYRNAAGNTLTLSKQWILNGISKIKGPNNTMVLKAIEGPNEMNNGGVGGGARGPDDNIDKTGAGQQTTVIDPIAIANFLDWAQQVHQFRQDNLGVLSSVELISGTLLNYTAANWPTTANVSAYVDYPCMHYYAGPHNSVPCLAANPDNFERMYSFALAGLGPGMSMVQSEGGFSSEIGGYAQDGRSSARYQIMQILDHFVKGGHRYMIYNLRNAVINDDGSTNVPGTPGNVNENNFGQFWGNWTPKPAATALHNLQNLLSLGNDYTNTANLTDNTSFTPNYSGVGLSVNGLQAAGSAGSVMVMPKSDNTCMIAVWNEPIIDDGNGVSLSSGTGFGNQITVNFGATYNYKVYDAMGGGNAINFTATTNAVSTPIATGTGSAVNLTLNGQPLFIEIIGSAGGGGGGTTTATHGLVINTDSKLMVLNGELCYT